MGDHQEQDVISLINAGYDKHLRRGNTEADFEPTSKICPCKSLQCK